MTRTTPAHFDQAQNFCQDGFISIWVSCQSGGLLFTNLRNCQFWEAYLRDPRIREFQIHRHTSNELLVKLFVKLPRCLEIRSDLSHDVQDASIGWWQDMYEWQSRIFDIVLQTDLTIFKSTLIHTHTWINSQNSSNFDDIYSIENRNMDIWGFGVGSLCLFSIVRVQSIMIPRRANCVL